jgi:hypothetical protein
MSTLMRQLLLGISLIAALVIYHLVTSERIASAEQNAAASQSEARELAGQLAAAKSSERIVVRYVDRTRVVREQGATIVQRIPIYVTAQADAACVLPRGFVRLHDAAAQGAEVPVSAGAADAQPSGIALSAATGVVVDNYTTCRGVAEQLKSLQAWVRANGGGAP